MQAVVFDVDGTLVDTNYLHVRCWSEAFDQAGHVVEDSRIHRAIGMSSELLLDRLLGPDRDKTKDERITSAHRTLYAQHWGHLRPLPGAQDLLHACAQRGLAIALASSAQEDELSALRNALDCDDVIDACTSASEAGKGKPHPSVVEAALAELDMAAEFAILVGDTVWDVEAGLRVPMPVIAVMSGGICYGDLAGAGATEVYEGPRELLEQLDHTLTARR